MAGVWLLDTLGFDNASLAAKPTETGLTGRSVCGSQAHSPAALTSVHTFTRLSVTRFEGY